MSNFDAGILDTSLPMKGLSAIMGAIPRAQTADELAQERDETRNRKAVADYNETRAREAQRAAQRQQLIDSVYARHNGDTVAADNELATLDPELALKIRKGRSEEFGARMKAELEGADRAAALARLALADPERYPQLRQLMADRLPEDVRAVLPEQFDAEFLGRLPEIALTAKESMEESRKYHDWIMAGDWRKGLAGQLSLADDQEEWDNIIKSYAPEVPKEALATIPPWTPDGPEKMKAFVMGPKAVEDLKQNETRDKALTAQGWARVGEDKRHNIATEGETRRNHDATLAKGGAGGGNDREDLIEAVIANPGLYDQITPTERGKIAGELYRRGYTGFGRPLSEGAAKQIAATDAAVASLADLREILKKNEKYLGPVAGLAAMNPYSDARKAQADIDLVRQRVGKALEGGVLRKEDETKYKQILATLRDTPDLAIYKVDQLVKDLERDKSAFIHQQRLTGRSVPQGGAAGGPSPQTTKREPKVGDIVKHNGKRYRVKAISGGAADLEPI